eukprot:TRINITY_DN1405_c0_g2_i3.p1 TRINITY_DN1405_c0_g2~~TRINITY_DN1405_c0_g2_i3.p1  ORF type:complete len:390 (+),score=82.25 TRINITY_DN1405_c0_g2_i3:44-1171(+)
MASSLANNLRKIYPFYISGRPVLVDNNPLQVVNKHDGQVVTHVSVASAEDINDAIENGTAAEHKMKKLPSYTRKKILGDLAGELLKMKEDMAKVIAFEAGKTITDATGEVLRAVDVLQHSSEEAVRNEGDYVHADISPRADGMRGIVSRFPRGLSTLITPFNFPLNLAVHKVGPAIAAGNPFILKPSPRTPLSSILFGKLLEKTDLPKDCWSIINCDTDDIKPLVEDQRVKMVSFTGSTEVGWMLNKMAGNKKVHLELGGNAANIIDRTCNLDHSVDRIAWGSFYNGGQSCISAQRIYVHEAIYEEFKQKLLEKVSSFKILEPNDPAAFLSPVISDDSAERLMNNIEEVKRKGGRVLCGGTRSGNIISTYFYISF